jgi:hypothetical protein
MIEPSAGAPLEPLPSTVMMRAGARSGAIARGVAAGGVHIASVRTQSYAALEILVGNNASEDGSFRRARW